MKALTRRGPALPVSPSFFDVSSSLFNDSVVGNLDATFRALFNEAFSDRTRFFDIFANSSKYPKVDARVTEKAFEIDLAVPGCKENEIDILYNEGVLTVKYTKNEKKKSEKGSMLIYNELRHSSWQRAWKINEKVKEEEISASLENGILNVIVPLAEPKKEEKPGPRKIQISSGEKPIEVKDEPKEEETKKE